MAIKKPDHKKGGRISTPAPIVDYDKKPPLFSLEKLVNGSYCLSQLEQEDKAFFADAMFRRKDLTWSQLKSLDRHALGFEKIARDSIKVAIPAFVTEDVDHFLAFRFHGLKPMVGLRTLDIFYVLWFDHDFTLYNH